MNSIESFLEQILKPYERFIFRDGEFKKDLEEIIGLYQYEFDTSQMREELKHNLNRYITEYITEYRDNIINEILKND